MQKILFLFCLGFLGILSCADNDDESRLGFELPERPVLSDNTPTNAKIKQLYEKYGIHFRYEFPKEDFTWDWTTQLSNPKYSPALEGRVLDAIDFIEENVFSIFPDTFLKRYLPFNVLMTDTLSGSYSPWHGTIASNYLGLGKIGTLWESADKEVLRDSWISLFVEKMLGNWTYPADFAKISYDGYNPKSGTISIQYYPATVDVVQTYALLKSGRRGFYNSNGRNVYCTSLGQDFGDFVAFIAYKKPSEKEEYYAKNSLIKTKVELLQEYFHQQFGFRLPEATE